MFIDFRLVLNTYGPVIVMPKAMATFCGNITLQVPRRTNNTVSPLSIGKALKSLGKLQFQRHSLFRPIPLFPRSPKNRLTRQVIPRALRGRRRRRMVRRSRSRRMWVQVQHALDSAAVDATPQLRARARDRRDVLMSSSHLSVYYSARTIDLFGYMTGVNDYLSQ